MMSLEVSYTRYLKLCLLLLWLFGGIVRIRSAKAPKEQEFDGIIKALNRSSHFSSYVNFIQREAVSRRLTNLLAEGSKGYTLWVPTNKAFAKLQPRVQTHLTRNITFATSVVSLLMTSPRLPTDTLIASNFYVEFPCALKGFKLLRNFPTIKSLVGVDVVGGSAEDAASVVAYGVYMTSRVVIHSIDKVLLPVEFRPRGNAKVTFQHALMALQRLGNYKKFLELITEAGIAFSANVLLQYSTHGMTLFAPTDDAFSQIPHAALVQFAENRTFLFITMEMHIVLRPLPIEKLLMDKIGQKYFTYARNFLVKSPSQSFAVRIAPVARKHVTVSSLVEGNAYLSSIFVVHGISRLMIPP